MFVGDQRMLMLLELGMHRNRNPKSKVVEVRWKLLQQKKDE